MTEKKYQRTDHTLISKWLNSDVVKSNKLVLDIFQQITYRSISGSK